METAIEYMEKAPDNRSNDTQRVFAVFQGSEPLDFTCHFHGWDWHKFPSKAPPSFVKPHSLARVQDILSEFSRTYTYEEILNKQYPKGIDTSKLEAYLSDEEFVQVLGVDREEFETYPVWKQQKIKREQGLF